MEEIAEITVGNRSWKTKIIVIEEKKIEEE